MRTVIARLSIKPSLRASPPPILVSATIDAPDGTCSYANVLTAARASASATLMVRPQA